MQGCQGKYHLWLPEPLQYLLKQTIDFSAHTDTGTDPAGTLFEGLWIKDKGYNKGMLISHTLTYLLFRKA